MILKRFLALLNTVFCKYNVYKHKRLHLYLQQFHKIEYI